jgi:S1-C subfamily serine protease
MIDHQIENDSGVQDPYQEPNQEHQAFQPYHSPYQQRSWDVRDTAPYPHYSQWGQQVPQVPQTPSSPQAPLPPANAGRKRGALRTGMLAVLVMLVVLIFGVGLFAGWQFSRTSSAVSTGGTGSTGTNAAQTATATSTSAVQTAQEAAIAKVKPSVVQINVTTATASAIGSGVIIDSRGYIVTNNHVISGAQSIEVVLYDGTRLTAQVVGTDAADDLAVLKVTTQKTLTAVSFGDSSKLQVGQDVLAIGNPLGITESVSSGIVSALNRTVNESQGGATINNAIQTDAAINPGNSGGALIDLQGNLIGIPTLGAIDTEFNTPANGVGFAIPSNLVASVAHSIITTGQA